MTIDGKATVAASSKTVNGLSKINRIVQFFAQRPQVQERLTQQISTRQTRSGTNNVKRYRIDARALLRALLP